ncbi:uncharacterized protein N7511_007408 [Penicillium nucicola]|uniref:uncharacterized protein n=1 Tax=Penicillium nucicola TaxID=1850975 RepID=UPI0025453623|nr:uncharacterized protein N7511_007408 [Penicillium nucicola]KAJ5757226.1 hypothetical protein N7511_007408 [Penicillium nucicola]
MSMSLISLLSRRARFNPSRSRMPVALRQLSTLPNTHIFRALQNHDPDSLAVVHSVSARSFTYGSLVADVVAAKEDLERKAANANANAQGKLAGERVAFLAENSYDYVVTLLAILASDAIALPLSPSFPSAELKYILDNSQAKVLLATEKYADKAMEVLRQGLDREPILNVRKKLLEGAVRQRVTLEEAKKPSGGMMLYTSGTTNRPKGVLIPLSALAAQASSLLQAWNYSPDDRLLHLLPLHHIHGVVNAIVAPIVAGSSIEFMYPFNTDQVWKRLAAPFQSDTSITTTNNNSSKITFLTAVPTIYNRLLTTFPTLPQETQKAAKEGISPSNLRLNISGSAALPTPTKTSWSNLSNGNILLERFGMTEVGMAISCGLDNQDRVDGSVGWPLPGVEARLVDTENGQVIPVGQELDSEGRQREGEIQLRGETIFSEYWGNEKATREAFVTDNRGGEEQGEREGDATSKKWFCTGDVATRKIVQGAGSGASGDWAKGPMYFIQGRKSVDIIKSGAEKISALEVERELLSLPQIVEAAVVGLPSEKWGQKVAAIVVLHPEAASSGRSGKSWGPMDMRRALKDSLAAFKIPSEMKVLDAIPRNAMGKVNKKALVKEVFDV